MLEQIHPRLVLPMHWFTREVMERFVSLVAGRYDVRWKGGADAACVAGDVAGEGNDCSVGR